MASPLLSERRFDRSTGPDSLDFARSADGRVLPGVSANEALRLLAEAEALRARAVAHLSVADNHEIAALRGYLSPSRMIAHKTSASKAEAEMLARIAAFIGRHPATAAALADGRITIAYADHLARAEHRLRDEYARDENQLLAACESRDPEELGRFVSQWRWNNNQSASQHDAARSFNNRGVSIQEGFDGSGSVHANLDATGLATVTAALETPPDRNNGPDEPRTLAQRRADRLVGICDDTLDGAGPTNTGQPDGESRDDTGNERGHGRGEGDTRSRKGCGHDARPDGSSRRSQPRNDATAGDGSGDDADPDPSNGEPTLEKEPVRLSPESADLLLNLLAGEPVNPNRDTADEICAALGLPTLADIAMGASSRSTIDVIVDIETLLGRDHPDIGSIQQTLADGRPIPTEVWERLACDTSIRRVVTKGNSQILNYGRKTAVISPQLRNAIRKRDLHCQFAGCDIAARYCDIHHLIPWHKGGRTDEQNLACVCRRHHNMIHDAGWTLTRSKSGLLITTSP